MYMETLLKPIKGKWPVIPPYSIPFFLCNCSGYSQRLGRNKGWSVMGTAYHPIAPDA